MSVLRFFMLLSLVVWLGGIIFFAFVVAPTVFSVLPTRHLAAANALLRTAMQLPWPAGEVRTAGSLNLRFNFKPLPGRTERVVP